MNNSGQQPTTNNQKHLPNKDNLLNLDLDLDLDLNLDLDLDLIFFF
jgi:hypothetical protein